MSRPSLLRRWLGGATSDGGDDAAERMALMLAARPPLSPGMAKLREGFLEGAKAHADVLERAARQMGLLPWIRRHLAEARRLVTWVHDQGADDPADYLAAVREGRPWSSIGEAGLMAAADRSHEALTAAARFLEGRACAALSALDRAAAALAVAVRLCLRDRPPRPVALRRRSPAVDRGPPARRRAFTGQINRALP